VLPSSVFDSSPSPDRAESGRGSGTGGRSCGFPDLEGRSSASRIPSPVSDRAVSGLAVPRSPSSVPGQSASIGSSPPASSVESTSALAPDCPVPSLVPSPAVSESTVTSGVSTPPVAPGSLAASAFLVVSTPPVASAFSVASTPPVVSASSVVSAPPVASASPSLVSSVSTVPVSTAPPAGRECPESALVFATAPASAVVPEGSRSGLASPVRESSAGPTPGSGSSSDRRPPATRFRTVEAALPTVRATPSTSGPGGSGVSSVSSDGPGPSGRNWNVVPPQSGHPESISFEPSSNARPQSVHSWGIMRPASG